MSRQTGLMRNTISGLYASGHQFSVLFCYNRKKALPSTEHTGLLFNRANSYFSGTNGPQKTITAFNMQTEPMQKLAYIFG